MADPTDVAAENIANRTLDVKSLREAIYNRLMAFAALADYQTYNYIGSDDAESIVSGILELEAPNALVLAYNDSNYSYEPMADRAFSVYIAIRCAKLYVKDFTVDPLSDAVKAVVLALDKWAPGGHCRLRVTRDSTIKANSQTMSVAEVAIKAEDQ
jgi:hypothetical protein